MVATCPINHIFWAHPTCHPKAHRLSKKCMNNLGARFGPPKNWAHDLGGTPQNLGARFGRDPQKFGPTIWAELWGEGPWEGWVVIWAPHKRFGHPIMMECVELCMEFKQTYINYEHLSYTAAYKHPKHSIDTTCIIVIYLGVHTKLIPICV